MIKIFKYLTDNNAAVSLLLAISTLFTIATTYLDSKNNENSIIAIQNGTTMIQTLLQSSMIEETLVHNLLVRDEDCGYFNRPVNTQRCNDSKEMYELVKIEFGKNASTSYVSQENYTNKVNQLVKGYSHYSNLSRFFLVMSMLTNVLAIYLTIRLYRRNKT